MKTNTLTIEQIDAAQEKTGNFGIFQNENLIYDRSLRYSILAKNAIYTMLDRTKEAVRHNNKDLDGTKIVAHDIIFANALIQDAAKYLNMSSKSYIPIRFNAFIDKMNAIKEEERLARSPFKLITPALKEAYDRGILNERNYKEIKDGGLMVLEKYSTPNIGVVNIYSTLEHLYEPKEVHIVYKDEDSFMKEVNYKRRIFQEDIVRYNMENREFAKYELKSIEVELELPSTLNALEETLGVAEAETQLKTMSEIFKN